MKRLSSWLLVVLLALPMYTLSACSKTTSGGGDTDTGTSSGYSVNAVSGFNFDNGDLPLQQASYKDGMLFLVLGEYRESFDQSASPVYIVVLDTTGRVLLELEYPISNDGVETYISDIMGAPGGSFWMKEDLFWQDDEGLYFERRFTYFDASGNMQAMIAESELQIDPDITSTHMLATDELGRVYLTIGIEADSGVGRGVRPGIALVDQSGDIAWFWESDKWGVLGMTLLDDGTPLILQVDREAGILTPFSDSPYRIYQIDDSGEVVLLGVLSDLDGFDSDLFWPLIYPGTGSEAYFIGIEGQQLFRLDLDDFTLEVVANWSDEVSPEQLAYGPLAFFITPDGSMILVMGKPDSPALLIEFTK
ncbi:MAG: hypothetical protein FWD45_00355 [Coriobacteriia bacterium]|nr:hypothetical protein [Coriobacteriia bacterium]